MILYRWGRDTFPETQQGPCIILAHFKDPLRGDLGRPIYLSQVFLFLSLAGFVRGNENTSIYIINEYKRHLLILTNSVYNS
jgi:hypothetical protein